MYAGVVAAPGLQRSAACTRGSVGSQRGLRRSLVVRAQQGGDWQDAFKRVQKQIGSQVEVRDEETARLQSYRSRGPSGLGAAQDRLRAQERVLVDLWSSADFLKVGGVMAVLLVFALASATSGGPPMDPRCTLPWC